MSVSAQARATQVIVLGGLLALALYFPYLWFGVTPFGSDNEFSEVEIAELMQGREFPDFYAQPLPERSVEELARQKEDFTWCRFCHTLEEGGHNRVGPNLHGIFGQPAGVVDLKRLERKVGSGLRIIWQHLLLTLTSYFLATGCAIRP